ncbi:MAG: sigma-54-dependent Fis family transcriptional regulator [Planctomycetota bacterium]|nr:sigma-54-dependent Fis family transcriptional regulator [Planctomycetota bacterium]
MKDHASTILVADDDPFIRDDLGDLLKDVADTVLFAETAHEALSKIKILEPDLVLLDVRFPDSQDLSPLKSIRENYPHVEVIILSSQTEDISLVVQAIKIGASDYVAKPFVPEELKNRVVKALELQAIRRSQRYLLEELQRREGLDRLEGSSPAMKQVRDTIRKLSDTAGCVLIRGESGTGKELAARALHYLSKRRNHPFLAINCAAVPENLVEAELFGHKKGAFTGAVDHTKGKFEAAGEGTVFLDEIGDMPMAQQAALLRVLEYRKFMRVGENVERECKARFVLATNRDLREMVKQGAFREDLFYRINVATIQMPPLRSRVEDVVELSRHMVMRLASEMGRPGLSISSEVMNLFARYDWPGNVRELKNVLEAVVMLKDMNQPEIIVQDLPPEILALKAAGDENSPPPIDFGDELKEKERFIQALQKCQWNQSKAARLLGCHRNTIRNRIRYYGITHLEGSR